VLYGYGCTAHPWDGFIGAEAEELSWAAGYGGSVRVPSAEGEHYEWQLAAGASHAFLAETHSEHQPGYDSALDEAELVWPGALWLLQRPIPLSGHLADACTGEPMVATISYPGVDFQHGEVNASFMPFGRYHAFLPPGPHTVAFAAPGYATETLELSVSLDSAQVTDVALTPVSGCPPVCEPSSLAAASQLKGVKDAAGGAAFQWQAVGGALEHHLDSVDSKSWLNPVDARPWTAGHGVLECRAVDPACTDADALDAGRPLLFYLAAGACGPAVDQQGPLF
jgi:hypothetical protein